MDIHLFSNGLVYLLAAAIAAPLGRRLGLGAVLGYLIIGAIIGPACLGLVGEDREEVLHFAEFGVVLMLFVVGLELDLSKLWRMRGPIFGLGGAQVGATTLVIGGVAMLTLDLDWREGLAVGLTLALSSTAIVLQTLRERGLHETSSGTQSFAVLLFQDMAVIPILAILPLLAHKGHGAASGAHGDAHGAEGASWISSLPAYGQAGAIIGAVLAVVLVGRFLLNPWFHWVAKLGVTEAFTATTLALVVGVALLMNAVGLSPALGTFIAGVVLASSAFRHELESDIEPFKALLLAVFFLAVGAGINFELIGSEPMTIGLMVFGLIALKFLVLFVLGRLFGISFDQRVLFAAALAQGGEFAFVLGGFAVAQGVISDTLASQMISAVALSMALAPLILLTCQNWILPRIGTRCVQDDTPEREPDVQNDGARVLLAGFGRFGHPLARLLRSAGCMPTVLERDSDHVDFVRRMGLTVYYGDATRLSLLRAAGAEEASILIVAVDDEDESNEIIETCQKHFPKLKILARACSRNHAYDLHDLGVTFFVEQLGSSLDCAIAALVALGHESDHAKDAARRFKEHELQAIDQSAPHRHDEEGYIGAVQQNLRDLDSLLDNAPLPTKTGGTSA